MFEIFSIGLGFSLTEIFIFSLGLLYFIDYRSRSAGGENRVFYISLGVLFLLILLLGLIYTGKYLVYNSFLAENTALSFRFLTIGIIFGVITFPFVLRASTRLFIRV
ncbi:hypothetical protein [Persephonella sp.]